MMNNKLIIIAGSSLIFVFGLLLLMFIVAKPRPQTSIPQTTPAQVEPTEINEVALMVVSTQPEDNQNSVPLESVVEIVFNRIPKNSELKIEFMDDTFKPVPYAEIVLGSKITLKPKASLNQSTIYTVRVRNSALKVLKEFRFLTLTLEAKPDTRPVPLITKLAEDNLTNYPDVFLNNELPYESYNFNMEAVVGENSNLNFVVSSNTLSGEMLKERVYEWLLGLGLKEEQIATLIFIYP